MCPCGLGHGDRGVQNGGRVVGFRQDGEYALVGHRNLLCAFFFP
jgi:hypothetical protein